MVGPLNVRNAKPLLPDLEEFVGNSEGHGFIIVSFGSNLASIFPPKVVDILATAFGKLKQRVVWRIKGNIGDIVTNTPEEGRILFSRSLKLQLNRRSNIDLLDDNVGRATKNCNIIGQHLLRGSAATRQASDHPKQYRSHSWKAGQTFQ